MAVDLIMPAVSYPAHLVISFTHCDITAQAAVGAHSRGGLQVPFAYVVLGEGFIGKHPGRANLGQVTREAIF